MAANAGVNNMVERLGEFDFLMALADPVGFEPTAYGSGGRRSDSMLSYGSPAI